ncbi:MAG: hypothetical protein K2X39_09285 [Silvanigrellaceae bacterium]|nr:hypothetical protein [Silvanigrellaceae bacterium]
MVVTNSLNKPLLSEALVTADWSPENLKNSVDQRVNFAAKIINTIKEQRSELCKEKQEKLDRGFTISAVTIPLGIILIVSAVALAILAPVLSPLALLVTFSGGLISLYGAVNFGMTAEEDDKYILKGRELQKLQENVNKLAPQLELIVYRYEELKNKGIELSKEEHYRLISDPYVWKDGTMLELAEKLTENNYDPKEDFKAAYDRTIKHEKEVVDNLTKQVDQKREEWRGVGNCSYGDPGEYVYYELRALESALSLTKQQYQAMLA